MSLRYTISSACPRAADGPGVEPWKFFDARPSPAMRSTLLADDIFADSRPSAASTFSISWPRSLIRGKCAADGTVAGLGSARNRDRAVIASPRSFAAIGQGAADAGPEALAGLGVKRGRG